VTESTVSWVERDAAPPPARTLLVDLDVDARGGARLSQSALLWHLLDGAGTRPCANIFDSERESAVSRHHHARIVAAAWVTGQLPPAEISGSGEAADDIKRDLDALRALPPAEQQARVMALRKAALTCDGRDLLDVLLPGGGQK
jgi:hypothetical protein